jgi:hypothetical protein
MRWLWLSVFALSCGTDKRTLPENPTNCAVAETAEGVEFRCTDKDGIETSGLVRHGETGAKGEQGVPGEPGKGLKLKAEATCKGVIKGWLEGSTYQIEFRAAEFETGDTFLTAWVKALRGDETARERSTSAFFSSPPLYVTDGTFSMAFDWQSLTITSLGGISETIACEVK